MGKNKGKDSPRSVKSREAEKAALSKGKTTVSRHFKAGSQRNDGTIREQDGYEKTQ